MLACRIEQVNISYWFSSHHKWDVPACFHKPREGRRKDIFIPLCLLSRRSVRLSLFTGSRIYPHPPLVMDESRETATKRPLESSLPWIRNRGEAEAEAEADYINPTPKRPCMGRDGDSFEEFFALLKRIEATHRYCFRTRNHLNRQESSVKSVKTVASNASWRPSFEWEDFSSRWNGTRDVESSLSALKAEDGQVEEEEVVRHASKILIPESSTNPDLEGLDLNSLPVELPLFK